MLGQIANHSLPIEIEIFLLLLVLVFLEAALSAVNAIALAAILSKTKRQTAKSKDC